MSKIDKVSLGADPEFFLLDTTSNTIVSAEGLIGGTKDQPIPISENGHAIQEDNVMAEFNIPPCIDAKTFNRELKFVIDSINDRLPGHLVPCIKPSNEFDESVLTSEQAKMFGCDPDYNVWEMRENKAPEASTTLRTCGGHIHVGYADHTMEDSEFIIQAMDLFLGVPSIIMDTDTRRREMYGKAGSFRFKDYGVEYRTLSNFWIATENLRKWAFNNTMKAIEWLNAGGEFSEQLQERIVDCINNQNVELARELVKEFNIEIVEVNQEKENYVHT